MIDLAPTIIAIATPLTALGGAASFVWNKVQQRFEKIETELSLCRERETKSLKRAAKTLKREANHITVIELLWNELATISPKSRALERGKHLLDELKNGAIEEEGS